MGTVRLDVNMRHCEIYSCEINAPKPMSDTWNAWNFTPDLSTTTINPMGKRLYDLDLVHMRTINGNCSLEDVVIFQGNFR